MNGDLPKPVCNMVALWRKGLYNPTDVSREQKMVLYVGTQSNVGRLKLDRLFEAVL